MKKQDNEGEESPVLDAERRRFIQIALGGLAGLGLAGAAAGSAFAAPIAVSPSAFDDDCTTTTVVTRGPKTVTLQSKTNTYTNTAHPDDPGGTGPVTVNGTLQGSGSNPWSATYSYTTTGTYTASGGTLTGTYTHPEQTTVVTYSKTSTTPCPDTVTTTETVTGTFTTIEHGLAFRYDGSGSATQIEDLDAAGGMGTEVRLA